MASLAYYTKTPIRIRECRIRESDVGLAPPSLKPWPLLFYYRGKYSRNRKEDRRRETSAELACLYEGPLQVDLTQPG